MGQHWRHVRVRRSGGDVRTLLAVIGTALATSGSAAGDSAPPASGITRERPPDAIAQAAFDRGRSRSQIFARLVEELEGSDVIVHVERFIRLQQSIGGQLFFVTEGAEGDRFLRIRLNARAAAFDMTATLAHELQHALEVARAAGVRDEAGLARLYRAIGTELEPGVFDSRAARDVEALVRAELFGASIAAVRASCGWMDDRDPPAVCGAPAAPSRERDTIETPGESHENEPCPSLVLRAHGHALGGRGVSGDVRSEVDREPPGTTRCRRGR
jgi:hypothetical protein